METYRKKQTERQKKVCYDFRRFRDSSVQNNSLNDSMYIAFFRAYLDTILKALGAPLLSSAPSRKQTSHTFYSPGGRNYLLTFSSKEKEIDN